MIIKYVDAKVILCAVTKYSPNKIRAGHIIGGFGEAYALKISKSLFERIVEIHERRKNNYTNLNLHLNPSCCEEKRPVDFRGHIMTGSTGDYLDQQHLNDMFDQIIIEMDIECLDKFSADTAHEFCDKAYDAMGTNKRRLGLIIRRLIEDELVFENEYQKDEKKLIKEFRKAFKEPQYKLDLIIFAECIADGMNSNLDFEMIIDTEHFIQSKELRKLYTAIKRVYGHSYKDLIVPLSQAYGT